MRSRLVVSCPDQPGIVAAIAGFLFESGANILSSAQHSGERFFLRMEFEHSAPLRGFDAVAARFGMNYSVSESEAPKRVAILVSREQHCLVDLLWRIRSGELEAELAAVVSNHEDTHSLAEPFFHVPNTSDIRESAEAEMLRILHGAQADLVVLARYMQILSGDFLAAVGVPVINIHHSFLPAFAGADPYGRAHERGVKIIGATAHYVTEELDAGPIIEQDASASRTLTM